MSFPGPSAFHYTVATRQSPRKPSGRRTLSVRTNLRCELQLLISLGVHTHQSSEHFGDSYQMTRLSNSRLSRVALLLVTIDRDSKLEWTRGNEVIWRGGSEISKGGELTPSLDQGKRQGDLATLVRQLDCLQIYMSKDWFLPNVAQGL